MVTKVFFDFYGSRNEQELHEDLVVESIQIWGHDVYYLPRRRNNFDGVYYDDTTSFFDKAYLIDMYIKTFEGFGGQGTFLAKFGLEIRDQVTFSVATRTFNNEIVLNESSIVRPREGDLIYFTQNKKLFEIKAVENKPFFYQLGELPMFDMTCELYEYSQEEFSTGIAEIDDIQQKLSVEFHDFALLTEDGYALKTEESDFIVLDKYFSNIEVHDATQDNDDVQEEADASVVVFNESDPYAEGNY